MTQIVSHFGEVITQLRPTLPRNTATAKAIDQHEPWKSIAFVAVDDGYVEKADELVRLVQAKELLAPYTARRIKDIRCSVCGGFGCGGC